MFIVTDYAALNRMEVSLFTVGEKNIYSPSYM